MSRIRFSLITACFIASAAHAAIPTDGLCARLLHALDHVPSPKREHPVYTMFTLVDRARAMASGGAFGPALARYDGPSTLAGDFSAKDAARYRALFERAHANQEDHALARLQLALAKVDGVMRDAFYHGGLGTHLRPRDLPGFTRVFTQHRLVDVEGELTRAREAWAELGPNVRADFREWYGEAILARLRVKRPGPAARSAREVSAGLLALYGLEGAPGEFDALVAALFEVEVGTLTAP